MGERMSIGKRQIRDESGVGLAWEDARIERRRPPMQKGDAINIHGQQKILCHQEQPRIVKIRTSRRFQVG